MVDAYFIGVDLVTVDWEAGSQASHWLPAGLRRTGYGVRQGARGTWRPNLVIISYVCWGAKSA